MRRYLFLLIALLIAFPCYAGNFTATTKLSSWDLYDSFSDARSAGSVNGTTSDSGHTRTVTDTENKLSITGGNLSFSGGKASPAWSDPIIRYSGTTRSIGLLSFFNFTTPSNSALRPAFGLYGSSTIGSPTNAKAGFYLVSGTLYSRDLGSSGLAIGPSTISTSYNLLLGLGSASVLYFAKGGIEYPYWGLLYIKPTTDTTTPLYPFYNSYDAVATSSFVGIPSTRWLPTPLLSHGMSVVTPSDGLGHAETTGLGSGGSGAVMTGATWSISSGKAVNTPTEGAELVTNGEFTTNTTGWTQNNATISRVDSTTDPGTVSGGADNYVLKVIDGGSGAYGATDPLGSTVGVWYSVSGKLFSPSSNVAVNAGRLSFAGSTIGDVMAEDEWQTKKGVKLATATTHTVQILPNSATDNDTVYADSVSVKPLTLSSLFLTTPLSTSNVVVSADLTVTAGTQAGLGLRLDSASSPTKGLVAYTDGTYCKLDQFATATTWTNLISAACTYSAGAKMVAITDGTSARLYYNNTLVGTTASVDAGITGTIHGLFSTSSSNSIDNLTIYARGTDGEYSYLNTFVNDLGPGITAQ